jgi:hypothetical protein
MNVETERPTLTERGDEAHQAWGLIGASRVSSSPPGASLFDSDIRHQHYVVVRLRRASRRRDLGRDWKHGEEQIAEVAMSEAQWASFVSTMNVGEGVPCTIETVGRERMPGVEHEPRLAESMDEVTRAGEAAMEKINEAFAAYREKKTAANLRSLESAIANAPANMTFAAESLSEHAENVVQRARADVEAMVVHKAEQLGLDPGELGGANLLGSGEPRGEV